MASSTEKFHFDHRRVEDSVGYLLSRSRAKIAKALDVAVAEYDITQAQGGILLVLASGKFSTAADLARELYIDSASMTRMVDRLEKRKLIERVRRTDDRRVVDLRLTTDGQALAAELPPIYSAVLNKGFAKFSVEEIDQLRGLLRKFLGCDAPPVNTDPVADPD